MWDVRIDFKDIEFSLPPPTSTPHFLFVSYIRDWLIVWKSGLIDRNGWHKKSTHEFEWFYRYLHDKERYARIIKKELFYIMTQSAYFSFSLSNGNRKNCTYSHTYTCTHVPLYC